MAAKCGRCARKLQSLRMFWSSSNRSLATAANPSSSPGDHEGHNITSSRKRDPMAVLSALASTVQCNDFLPNPEFIEDIFLLPRSIMKQKDCLLAKQSGQRAAEYVIKKCPWIFPLRQPNPEWPSGESLLMLESAQNEDDLKCFINAKNAKKAVLCYEKLTEQGVEISLETLNQLLDLAAYSLGDISAEEALTPIEEDDEFDAMAAEPAESVELEDDGLINEKDSESETSDRDEEFTEVQVEHKGTKNNWRNDNYAMKLFNSMPAKNGHTYQALILGLLKYEHYVMAFEMFQEMRKMGHQGTTSLMTYNLLLKGISQSEIGSQKSLAEMLTKNMKEEPAVAPNSNTYTALMGIILSGPSGSSKVEELLGIIRDMHAVGIEPTLAAFNYLVRAEYESYWGKKVERYRQRNTKFVSVNPAFLDDVITHLESLPRLPDIQLEEDFLFFRTAISAAYLCLNSNLALRIYDLAHRGNNERFLGSKRAPFYASFLLALIHTETNPFAVYEHYKQLVPQKLRPRDYVYTALFNMAHRTNNPRIVPKLYKDMRIYRVRMGERVVESMFRALGRINTQEDAKGHLRLMTDVLRWMKIFQLQVTPIIVTQLVRVYRYNGMLEKCWEALEMFPKRVPPPYSCLIDVLLSAQEHGDRFKVIKIFEKMASLGYNMNKKRRNAIYESAGLFRFERDRIDLLFKNLRELEERRPDKRSTPASFDLP